MEVFFKNYQENTCDRVSFLIKLQAGLQLIKRDMAQVFSCEFYEIFKNTFFTEHLRVTAFASPISYHCSLSIPLETIKKPEGNQ